MVEEWVQLLRDIWQAEGIEWLLIIALCWHAYRHERWREEKLEETIRTIEQLAAVIEKTNEQNERLTRAFNHVYRLLTRGRA